MNNRLGKGSSPLTPGERIKKEDRRKDQAKLEAGTLAKEIATPEGSYLLGLIEKQLMSCVNRLVDNDPECRGLLTVLKTVNHKINVGEKLLTELFNKNKG